MPAKPKIAFFDFASCEGCQLTVVDSLQTHVELLDAVEIVQFREAMTERGEDYQIAFVEGSCTRQQDEERLLKIREQAAVVIALGACAHMGGVNALRNRQAVAQASAYVYGNDVETPKAYAARPASEVITVDYFIPGCPIDQNEFIAAVKALLQGRAPQLPDYPVCVECKLRENACVMLQGKACLGSVTRAGCDAICTALGVGCEGCRGLIPNPNLEGLAIAMSENNIPFAESEAKQQLFLTSQLLAVSL